MPKQIQMHHRRPRQQEYFDDAYEIQRRADLARQFSLDLDVGVEICVQEIDETLEAQQAANG